MKNLVLDLRAHARPFSTGYRRVLVLAAVAGVCFFASASAHEAPPSALFLGGLPLRGSGNEASVLDPHLEVLPAGSTGTESLITFDWVVFHCDEVPPVSDEDVTSQVLRLDAEGQPIGSWGPGHVYMTAGGSYCPRTPEHFGGSVYANNGASYWMFRWLGVQSGHQYALASSTDLFPFAPSDLRAIDATANFISLEWTDNSDNETGFELQRALATGPWDTTLVLGANSDATGEYEDDTVKKLTDYRYRIRAVRNAHYSQWSNELLTSTLGIPREQAFGIPEDALDPTREQGDPVNSLTGAYTTQVTDLSLPGIGLPFQLTRSYTSADTTVGNLGVAWTHSYAASLTVRANGNVLLRGGTGQQLLYKRRLNGTFKPNPGGRSKLSTTAEGYELRRMDQTVLGFDSSGRMTSIRDRNGNDLTLSYDATGLDKVVDTVGRVIEFTNDASGLLTLVALPDGRSVSYGYTNGRLTVVTDVRGGLTGYRYNSDGLLDKITDQNNNAVVTSTYNANGRVTEQLDARGKLTIFDWDAATQTQTMTDARGNQWKDVHDAGVLVRRVDPLGNRVAYSYDDDLNVKTITDPKDNVWTMTYDNAGNMLSRTAPAPLNYREDWTYTARNDVDTYRNPRGFVTDFDYDPAGNLQYIREPESVVTQFQRDPSGNGLVTSIIDPRIKETKYGYDTFGDVTSITTPRGKKTTLTYDLGGRVLTEVEARGNEPGANPADYTWTFVHDPANHVTEATDPLGNRTKWFYDPAGNLDKMEDPKLRLTDYNYNPANYLTEVDPPEVAPTSYTYDPAGNLETRTDGNGRVTTYRYDVANRLERIEAPGTRTWSFAYDKSGNRTETTDAIGNSTPSNPSDGITKYGYDELNRLKTVDYSDATPDVALSYDENSNLVSMTDGSGTASYLYDNIDRLKSVTRGTNVFSYLYDPSGNVTRRTYPGGRVIDYFYDDDSLLDYLMSGGKTTDYDYDAVGRLIKTTLPATNGHAETRTYDRAGRLTEVKNQKGATTLWSATYTLDQTGNPTAVTSTEGTRTYRYDGLDRLTEVCFAATCTLPTDPFIRYTYDQVGNRLTESRPTGTTTYNYNSADELTGTSGLTSKSYSHDLNGNLTAAGTTLYTYDQANRMATAKVGNTTTTYAYDGLGRRLKASTGTQAAAITKYLWDENFSLPQLAVERNGNDALLRDYVHGLDLVSMTSGGADYYFHYDGLGSVMKLTNSSGAAQWTYSYEPFGSLRSETKNNSKAPTNLMRFTGELFDSGTGLYHLRARQYDPGLGRFLQRDPWFVDLMDPYVSPFVYVKNRPNMFVDPSGLCGWGWSGIADCVGDAAGVVSTVASGVAVVATGAIAVGAVAATAPVSLPVIGVTSLGAIAAGAATTSLVASGVGASAQIVETGADSCSALSVGSALTNAVAAGAATYAKNNPTGLLLTNVIGLEGSLQGLAGSSICQPELGTSQK